VVQLRKICNHPYLFDITGDEDLNVDMPVQHVDHSKLDAPAVKATGIPEIVTWSGKMLLLERLLPKLFEKGHKVLIFSQMTRMLDIIADWFEFVKRYKFCRIDGSVRMDIRRQQIHAFNTDPSIQVFLLSTRAGGLGINLTAADTVIIVDSDWNPQADLQAQDRVHRIGQTKPVIVYRLATAQTVECKILDKARSKRKLEKLVIHKGIY
jgi:ATP-dependent DNA helicase